MTTTYQVVIRNGPKTVETVRGIKNYGDATGIAIARIKGKKTFKAEIKPDNQ